jgi:uncharacterized membrane protein YeaQ/YmgE (transglycosylase-associated protein family)
MWPCNRQLGKTIVTYSKNREGGMFYGALNDAAATAINKSDGAQGWFACTVFGAVGCHLIDGKLGQSKFDIGINLAHHGCIIAGWAAQASQPNRIGD